jgi:5-methylthioadenosine/S-adenosylhomocysteine deaminase
VVKLEDLVLRNARAIIPMNGDFNKPKILKNQSILISGTEIVEIGERISIPRGSNKIDAEGKVVMPGLINSHTHLAMNLLKGYADDMKLKEWLEDMIWPFESKMSPDDIEFGARLGTLEAIASGTTTLSTMYHHSEKEVKALIELGLRAVVGHVCFSWRKDDDYNKTKRLVNDFHGSNNDLIRVSIDPHAAYTVDYEFLHKLNDLREKYNTKYENSPFIHTHAAETRFETQQTKDYLKNQGLDSLAKKIEGPIHYFEECGILKESCIAHGVWVSEKEVNLIKKSDARIASCPVSNLKLSSGIAPIKSYLDEGITVGLGTDGSSSNNSLDMFETLKIASLLQKVSANYDPQAIPAYQALWIGTRGSARAIHWDQSIGSIEPGKKADIIMVDLKKPHLIPTWNEISNLVYVTKGSDVSDVIVNGSIIYRNYEFTKIDFHKFYGEVEGYLQDLRHRMQNLS